MYIEQVRLRQYKDYFYKALLADNLLRNVFKSKDYVVRPNDFKTFCETSYFSKVYDENYAN